jgi:DNA helicase HerA-like ATPase
MITLDDVHRMIASPTGSGKSYFAGYLAEQLYFNNKRFIIFDIKADHIGLLALKKVKLLKIKPQTHYSFFKLANYIKKGFSFVVVPTQKCGSDEYIQQCLMLLDVLFNSKCSVTIFIEEAHRYNESPRKPTKIVDIVAREGRKYKTNLTFITQRIQEFPSVLWEQCKVTYLFKITHPATLRYVENFIPDIKNINPQLQKYDVLEYNHVSGEWRIIKSYEIVRKTKHYG